ncbi:MAG: BON domain-containing protein [Nitrospiraceae bacterium]
MKPILQALTYAAIAASLVGCGMNSGKTRTSSTSSDTPRVTTSEEKVAVNDETRMRTVDRTLMHSTTEDMATASAVKKRITDDQTINPNRITVQADRGTVYLNGSVDSRDQKTRAEQQAAQVAGVSSVVNRLHIGDERSAIREEGRACTFVSVIPATRTESSFGAVEVRVFDDIHSPLYRRTRDQAYESRDRAYYEERRRGIEGRPDLSEITPSVPVLPGEATPSGAGPTGGTMQSTAAQQGGTLEQNYRGDDDTRLDTDRRRSSSERTVDAPRTRAYDERRLSSEERSRLYNEEARLSDRRGDLIWSGWLKNGEKRNIASERGPIRYDYRYSADDRFHDNKGAWCNDGNRVIVP